MNKTRVTRTTIRAREVYVFKRRRSSDCGSCGSCGNPLLVLDEAVSLARASSRQIHRWMDQLEIHFTETPEGLVLLCSASLLERVKRPR